MSDGCVEVVAVRSCSRAQYVHHLVRLNNPDLGDHTDFPYVLCVKARAWRFTPAAAEDDGSSRWNVDGELLPPAANALRATVEPALLSMYAFTPPALQ